MKEQAKGKVKRFVVLRPEVHYSHVVVEAESDEDAIALVEGGAGEELTLEYSHTIERWDKGWGVYREGENPTKVTITRTAKGVLKQSRGGY